MRATPVSPNLAPSPLNGWVLNTLLGWGKGRENVSFFQILAPSFCPLHP